MATESTALSPGYGATCCLKAECEGHSERSAPSARTGRDGLLHLVFERSGDGTILRRCRYRLPLQVLAPHLLDDGTSYLLLLNPTGGVVGGDRLETEIALGEGARVCLSTPSATRIYRTSGPAAEMETAIRVGRNATLEYLPDHVIPHAGSSLRQSLRVEMEEGSRAIVLDTFAVGRVALGERWCFRDFDSRLEIFLRGGPVFLNRSRIIGPPLENNQPVVIKSANIRPSQSYFGMLVVIADRFGDWFAVVEALRVELEAMPEVLGGASLLAHCGCSVRFLAHSAIDLSAATERLWTAARQQVLGLPAGALRKY